MHFDLHFIIPPYIQYPFLHRSQFFFQRKTFNAETNRPPSQLLAQQLRLEVITEIWPYSFLSKKCMIVAKKKSFFQQKSKIYSYQNGFGAEKSGTHILYIYTLSGGCFFTIRKNNRLIFESNSILGQNCFSKFCNSNRHDSYSTARHSIIQYNIK